MNKSDILSRISLFENLSPQQLDSVAEITTNRMVKKREQLFHSGAPGDLVFVLVQGAVQLYNISPDGREVVLKVVKPGEMFGEVVLFERETYPVSSVALKNSQLFSFSRSSFLRLLDQTEFRDAFIAQIMKKMRYLTVQFHNLSSYEVADRLLIFLKDHHGDSKEFTIGLSKKDIAAAIGTTSETLSRTIKRLQECGKITWEGKKITIH